MVSVCFQYDRDGGTQNDWDYVLSNFSVDALYVYGPADTKLPSSNVLKDATLIQTVDELPSGIPLVMLSPLNARFLPGEVSLVNFVHPSPDAIYLFGPNNVHLSSDELGNAVPDFRVYIPNDTRDQMFSYVAAAVTLYDRRVKLG